MASWVKLTRKYVDDTVFVNTEQVTVVLSNEVGVTTLFFPGTDGEDEDRIEVSESLDDVWQLLTGAVVGR